ncbi:hypothetical protein Plhal304r1_c074g0161971 [Plasmopara halstedii]
MMLRVVVVVESTATDMDVVSMATSDNTVPSRSKAVVTSSSSGRFPMRHKVTQRGCWTVVRAARCLECLMILVTIVNWIRPSV